MENEKGVRNQQSDSGSQSQHGQGNPVQRKDQGDPAKKGEEGHQQQGQQTPRKDVQSEEQDKEHRGTGTHQK